VSDETNRSIRVVTARSPTSTVSMIKLGVQNRTTRPLVEDGRLSALAEYVGIIVAGEVLQSPTAIFQGIKRPFLGDGLDNFVFVYISNPPETFHYYPRDRFAGTGPYPDYAPENSVFVVFVSLAPPVVEAGRKELGSTDDSIRGVILGWEWTSASQGNPRLPKGFGTRYRRQVC
jgi:hypothetical protein